MVCVSTSISSYIYCCAQIQELIAEGTESVSWGSADLEDFIQKSSSVICDDVYTILTRVHGNWERVKEMSKSWSEGE